MSTTILEENEEVEFSSVRAEGGENFSDRESHYQMLARK
jgi:hypothetical protein